MIGEEPEEDDVHHVEDDLMTSCLDDVPVEKEDDDDDERVHEYRLINDTTLATIDQLLNKKTKTYDDERVIVFDNSSSLYIENDMPANYFKFYKQVL